MRYETKIAVAMEIAATTASLSHDAETKVGSVLLRVDSLSVVSTGYNGFVKNAPDDILPNTRPEKYKYIVHSEENLLMNCARNGISTNNCLVVCTLTPCIRCMRLLYQAGIRRVIAKEKYKDFDEILQMKDIKITSMLEPTNNFWVLSYE